MCLGAQVRAYFLEGVCVPRREWGSSGSVTEKTEKHERFGAIRQFGL